MKCSGNPGVRASGAVLAAAVAVLCALATASSPSVAQTDAAAGAPPPPSSQVTEEIIIRAPEVVRRPLPRSGPGTPPGLTNPEIISLTSAVRYADLDLSKAADVAELQQRVRDAAQELCRVLDLRYPKTGGQYIYANFDCYRKATDDGLAVVTQITAARK
jgi:UrcA family protein